MSNYRAFKQIANNLSGSDYIKNKKSKAIYKSYSRHPDIISKNVVVKEDGDKKCLASAASYDMLHTMIHGKDITYTMSGEAGTGPMSLQNLKSSNEVWKGSLQQSTGGVVSLVDKDFNEELYLQSIYGTNGNVGCVTENSTDLSFNCCNDPGTSEDPVSITKPTASGTSFSKLKMNPGETQETSEKLSDVFSGAVCYEYSIDPNYVGVTASTSSDDKVEVYVPPSVAPTSSITITVTPNNKCCESGGVSADFDVEVIAPGPSKTGQTFSDMENMRPGDIQETDKSLSDIFEGATWYECSVIPDSVGVTVTPESTDVSSKLGVSISSTLAREYYGSTFTVTVKANNNEGSTTSSFNVSIVSDLFTFIDSPILGTDYKYLVQNGTSNVSDRYSIISALPESAGGTKFKINPGTGTSYDDIQVGVVLVGPGETKATPQLNPFDPDATPSASDYAGGAGGASIYATFSASELENHTITISSVPSNHPGSAYPPSEKSYIEIKNDSDTTVIHWLCGHTLNKDTDTLSSSTQKQSQSGGSAGSDSSWTDATHFLGSSVTLPGYGGGGGAGTTGAPMPGAMGYNGQAGQNGHAGQNGGNGEGPGMSYHNADGAAGTGTGCGGPGAQISTGSYVFKTPPGKGGSGLAYFYIGLKPPPPSPTKTDVPIDPIVFTSGSSSAKSNKPVTEYFNHANYGFVFVPQNSFLFLNYSVDSSDKKIHVTHDDIMYDFGTAHTTIYPNDKDGNQMMDQGRIFEIKYN
jgi:hypothetical protein